MQHPVRAALSVRELDEGLELHDLGSGSVHRLNPVASAVWRLCDGSRDLPAIAAAVAQQFGVSIEQVTPDVAALLTQFADIGLVQSDESSHAVEQLLLRCVQTALPGASAPSRHDASDPVDWDALVRLALRHGVLPLVQRHVAACSPVPVPDVVRERMESHAARIAADNRVRMFELLELQDLFARARIPAVSLKGPLLAATIYGDLSARQVTDLDIYVPPDRIREATALLGTRGHVVKKTMSGNVDTYRDRDGLSVDLQWMLASPEWQAPLDLAELWPRLQQTPVEGHVVPTARPDDCLRFLCAHGATHCWCALKWITDVAMLVERHKALLDWPALLATARQRGGSRQLLLGLRLAYDLLGSSLPAVVVAAIDRDPVVVTLATELRGRLFARAYPDSHQGSYDGLEGAWLYLRTRERIQDKVPFLLGFARRVVTPTEWDRAVVRLPQPLAWGYYVLRPFRLVARRLNRRRSA